MSAGADEAGRGPLIGPMVVAGVVLSKGAARKLRELGVTDSKRLSPKRREELYPLIIENSESYAFEVIEPRRIDEAVSKGMLNYLEAEVMAGVIKELGPSSAILDSPMRNCRKFVEIVKGFLEGMNVRIRAENFADAKYVQVASASIIAKVERDKRVKELSLRTGLDLGSGYPHDPKTREAIAKIVCGVEFPRDQVRWKWATVRNILSNIRSGSIEDFLC